MRKLHILTALPFACLFATAAAAQAPAPAAAPCTKQLSMIDEIQMEARGPGPSSVPVEINGTKQSLTLATAGTATQLTEAAAKTLGLNVTSGSEIALFDREGRASGNQVTLQKFTMGKLEGTNVRIPVAPGGGGRGGGGGGDDEGGFAGRGGGGRSVGLLSLNHMLPYDVDVDFGSNKLKFFSQDHCPGGVLYWQARPVGVMPITIDKGRVTVPVEIDGKALTGVIDTAAMGISVKAAVAERVLGLEPNMVGQSHTGALRLDTLNIRNTSFRIIGNGAIPVPNSPTGTVRNQVIAANAAMAQPEVVIGMELLRKLHIYMAFGEMKLYVTPASAPVAAAAPAAAGAAPAR